MPVTFGETVIRFDGACTVEEALPLLDRLRADRPPGVDLAGCSYLHTALLQVLLLLAPAIVAPPADPFLARWITPLLTRPAEDGLG